jgi:RimJ/RimL family protein N-acetyltransferase
MDATPMKKILIEKCRPLDSEIKLPFTTPDGKGAGLELITYASLGDEALMGLLGKWQERHPSVYRLSEKKTREGTRDWLKSEILDAGDRLLFWVCDSTGNRVGQVGLSHLSENRRCEIDHLLRDEPTLNAALMRTAVETLVGWQNVFLKAPDSYARVFGDNLRAIRFFESLGYREIQRVPLKKYPIGDFAEWKEIVADPYCPSDRYFITLRWEGGLLS